MRGGDSYGPGTGEIWLDDLNCSGEETTIEDCSDLEWGVNNCHHIEDVSIRCHPGDRDKDSGS